MTVTIYHNPDCGTSRNTLAMIRNAGIEPTVIEYNTFDTDLCCLINNLLNAFKAMVEVNRFPHIEC